MCGPGDRADDLAPRRRSGPSASTSARGRLLLPGGVGRGRLGGGAREEARVGQLPDEVGGVGDRRRGSGPAASGRSAVDLDRAASAVTPARRARGVLGLGAAPAPRPSGCRRPRSRLGLEQLRMALLGVERRADALGARRRRGDRAARRLASSARRAARPRRAASARSRRSRRRGGDVPPARCTTPATVAPVSSSTAARNRNSATMWRADAPEQRRRRPVERLADAPRRATSKYGGARSRARAAVGPEAERARGERQRQRREQAQRAGRERAAGSTGRSDERSRRRPRSADRHDVARRAPSSQRSASTIASPDLAAVPAEVDDEGEEHRQRRPAPRPTRSSWRCSSAGRRQPRRRGAGARRGAAGCRRRLRRRRLRAGAGPSRELAMASSCFDEAAVNLLGGDRAYHRS